MARRCSACDHPDRKTIDASLAVQPLRKIAERHSLSTTALHTHKTKHLKPAVARAIATRTDLSAQALVQKLADLLATCDEAIEKAKGADDLKALTSLIRESRELVVTIGRGFVGLWTDRPSVVVDARRQTLNVAVAELSDEQLRAAVKRAAALEPAIEAEAC